MIASVRFRAVLAVGTVILLAVFLLGLTVLTRRSASPSISVNVVGFTKDGSGNTVAVVRLANRTSSGFNYYFLTQVLQNGVWEDAARQHEEARMANFLPPNFQRRVQLPVPGDDRAWRVELGAGRVLGKLEMQVYRLFGKIRVRYPFAQDFQVHC